ncbi:ribosome biogenesis protein SLX9 homolog [Hyalella azteca]|uniref:Ribosome biogenesis protein SLX9 homolog n=1 Tax=Hyalella azteca TaxID=294128 RepID=A0A8B7PJY7_HYAAZ|nr:ribosome biogenesis protein SLX9 homolog [Hyalella azteca]
MGKARRQRKKYHAPAVGGNIATGNKNESDPTETMSTSEGNLGISRNRIRSDLFAGLNMNLQASLETRSLAHSDMDTMSLASMRSTKSTCRDGKKLDRRKQRRQDLLEILNFRRSLDEESLAQKKRQKTAVVGDMRPLTDALPSLERLQSLAQIQKAKEEHQKNSKKQSNLQKQLVDDVATFVSIAQYKDYQKDMFNLVGVSVQERLRRAQAGEDDDDPK